MIRQIVHGVLALVFAWQAVVFLSPIVIGLVHPQAPSGDVGLRAASIAVGIACVAAAGWCEAGRRPLTTLS